MPVFFICHVFGQRIWAYVQVSMFSCCHMWQYVIYIRIFIYICKYIYVYIHIHMYLYIYTNIHIYVWQGELCCFLLQFAYYLGVMVCLYDIVLAHMIICIWYTNTLCKETFVAFSYMLVNFSAPIYATALSASGARSNFGEIPCPSFLEACVSLAWNCRRIGV